MGFGISTAKLFPCATNLIRIAYYDIYNNSVAFVTPVVKLPQMVVIGEAELVLLHA